MPAPRLTFPLGAGLVAVGPDGTIESVRADPWCGTSYLDGGGQVTVRLGDAQLSWSETSVGADVDEVEVRYLGRDDLGVVIRHSFTGGWAIRVTFLNHTFEPLNLLAQLAWVPAATSPARAMAAGATAAYAVPGPDGAGPLLGGELVLGTCDTVSAESIGLGRFLLGPLGRQVVQWRWDWFAGPGAFRRRFATLPRDLVLPVGEAARIRADEDEAVVAPGVDIVRRGGQLELSSTEPQRVIVRVSSRRGVTDYEMEWVAPLDQLLIEIGEPLLGGPRNRASLIELADVDAALVAQRLLRVGGAGDPDDLDDALRLFSSRMEPGEVVDGRGIAFLCGECERLGEDNLLELATATLLGLPEPVPGLGLATAQLCMARLSLDWPVEPILTHLTALSAQRGGFQGGRPPGLEAARHPDADLGRTAVALELQLVGAGVVKPADRSRVEVWSTSVATGLGAGLPGRPVRPLSIDSHAYLVTVLGLLPESIGSQLRREWGCSLQDVARRAHAEGLARLGHRPPRPAHSWLIMGARLA